MSHAWQWCQDRDVSAGTGRWLHSTTREPHGRAGGPGDPAASAAQKSPAGSGVGGCGRRRGAEPASLAPAPAAHSSALHLVQALCVHPEHLLTVLPELAATNATSRQPQLTVALHSTAASNCTFLHCKTIISTSVHYQSKFNFSM